MSNRDPWQFVIYILEHHRSCILTYILTYIFCSQKFDLVVFFSQSLSFWHSISLSWCQTSRIIHPALRHKNQHKPDLSPRSCWQCHFPSKRCCSQWGILKIYSVYYKMIIYILRSVVIVWFFSGLLLTEASPTAGLGKTFLRIEQVPSRKISDTQSQKWSQNERNTEG